MASEEGQDFFRVALRLDLLPDVLDALMAVFIHGSDEEGGALDALDQLAVHVFGLDDAEGVTDLLVFVGEQRVLEAELVREFLLRFDGVARDAEHGGTGSLEVVDGVAKRACFNGAAGRVGAGIEEEHNGGFSEVGEGDGLPVLILSGKVFYNVVYGGCGHVDP